MDNRTFIDLGCLEEVVELDVGEGSEAPVVIWCEAELADKCAFGDASRKGDVVGHFDDDAMWLFVVFGQFFLGEHAVGQGVAEKVFEGGEIGFSLHLFHLANRSSYTAEASEALLVAGAIDDEQIAGDKLCGVFDKRNVDFVNAVGMRDIADEFELFFLLVEKH